MPKRDGQGEAKSDTKGREEEGKAEGEGMNREDVVQAALTVERWCREHWVEDGRCDCPFADTSMYVEGDTTEDTCWVGTPHFWGVFCHDGLAEFLRTRGMLDEK